MIIIAVTETLNILGAKELSLHLVVGVINLSVAKKTLVMI